MLSDKDPVQQEGQRERSGEAELLSRCRACELTRTWGAGGLKEMSDCAVGHSPMLGVPGPEPNFAVGRAACSWPVTD